MNDVFISYSRRDKVFTQKLFEALSAANRVVWADWDSIPAASDWDVEIKQGIEQTESVLFVLSPEWLKSNECRKELNHALLMGKRLFPMLYLPVDPKDVPPELASINWIYMRDSDDFDKAFQTLNEALDTDLDWVKSHTRIQVRAVEWHKKNRENSFLLRGKDLADGEQFISVGAHKNPEPTNLQGEYILASRKDASRRQRLTMAGVTIALVVSIALGVTAFFQRQAAVAAEAVAVTERDRAELSAKISFARELTASSLNVLDTDPELSILLALQASDVLLGADQSILPGTEDALRAAVQTSRLRYVVPANHRQDNTGETVPDELHGLAFSPDGKLLATGSFAGVIQVWKLSHFPYPSEDQKTYAGTVWLEPAFTELTSEIIYSIAFSPDGTQMVTTSTSPTVWDTQTGKRLFDLSGHKEIVNDVVFSPDGKFIATAGNDGMLIVWDAFNGSQKLKVSPHTKSDSTTRTDNIESLAFSPDGKFLASGGTDGLLIVSDVQTGDKVYTYNDKSFVHDIAFSPDGKYLTFGNGWNAVVTLDFETKEKVYEMKGHDHHVVSVFYSPDGNLLASAGHDGKIIVSNAHDGSEVFVLTGDKDFHIQKAAFSPDGKYIASVNWDGQLKIWDASPIAASEAGDFAAFTSPITGLDYSPDGSHLAASSEDTVAKIFSLPISSGESVDISLGQNYLNDIVFSPDGKNVATSSFWDGANIWDATTGNQLSVIGAGGAFSKVAFSPDGKSLGAAIDMEQRALIYDSATGKEVDNLFFNTNPGFGTLDVAFSPDGKWFAAVYNEETTQLLNLEKGTSILLSEDHDDWVVSVAFSTDGKYLLTASADGTAILRDLAAESKVITFSGQGPILDAAFSPDGTRIATASQDGTVKMWNTSDGTLLYTIVSPAGAINNIGFSPDGKTLAAGSIDGAIRFYYVQYEDVLTLAKERITRSLTEAECQTYLHEEACPETIAKPQEKSKPENLVPLQSLVIVSQVETTSSNNETTTESNNDLVRSGGGSVEVTFDIINNSGKTLQLNWMDYEGIEQPFSELPPGRLTQGTYDTHSWRIRDGADNLLLEYTATSQPVQTITINTDLTVTVQ